MNENERTEPTNEELSQLYTQQIEQAQKSRQTTDLERLERDGKLAANLAQSIEAELSGQTVELDETSSSHAEALAAELDNDGDAAKQARARELAGQFKEKASRDREEERGFSR